MMAWVDRTAYMERLWAFEGAQSRLFIDEVQLREGSEKTSNSIRARGGWDVYLTEFELEIRREPEEGLWLTANWYQVCDGDEAFARVRGFLCDTVASGVCEKRQAIARLFVFRRLFLCDFRSKADDRGAHREDCATYSCAHFLYPVDPIGALCLAARAELL